MGRSGLAVFRRDSEAGSQDRCYSILPSSRGLACRGLERPRCGDALFASASSVFFAGTTCFSHERARLWDLVSKARGKDARKIVLPRVEPLLALYPAQAIRSEARWEAFPRAPSSGHETVPSPGAQK